jgi:flagellar hook-associated protein 1 FlgK
VSGLFGLLGMSSRAMDAQRFGLDVTGQNLANVNTPGYSRRVVDLGAVPPANARYSAGQGVEVLGVRAQRERLFDLRLYREVPQEQREAAIYESLQTVEVALGEPGKSLDNSLTKFFDAWATLADAPTSATARAQVVAEGQALSSSFKAMAGRLDDASLDVDTKVRGAVEEINALASQVASLNAKISSVSTENALHLRDERTEALKKLATFVDIQTTEDKNGSVTVSFGLGSPLVTGNESYKVGILEEPTTGFARITSALGNDVTGQVTGGRLAGLIHTRDTLIPNYNTQLDALAYEVVQQVNTLHDAGFTLGGVDAPPFFNALGSATDAAELIGMNAAVTGNPSLVAAGGVAGTPGDNTVARNLANLRDAKLLAGNTASFGDAWSQIVYRVGQDGATAKGEMESRSEVVRQIENLQDSVAGVSLDEEAAAMMRFQRAYEANARYFSVINSALDVLMNLGR